MKTLIAILTLVFSSTAFAQHHGHRGHHGHFKPHHPHWHHSHGWIVPAIVGGAVVYAVTRPSPVIVQQPQQVVVTNEYMVVDGVTYKRELMVINGISQEVWVKQ